jgi:hypothetical protein
MYKDKERGQKKKKKKTLKTFFPPAAAFYVQSNPIRLAKKILKRIFFYLSLPPTKQPLPPSPSLLTFLKNNKCIFVFIYKKVIAQPTKSTTDVFTVVCTVGTKYNTYKDIGSTSKNSGTKVKVLQYLVQIMYCTHGQHSSSSSTAVVLLLLLCILRIHSHPIAAVNSRPSSPLSLLLYNTLSGGRERGERSS